VTNGNGPNGHDGKTSVPAGVGLNGHQGNGHDADHHDAGRLHPDERSEPVSPLV
jgi:hypothetical protein